MYKIYTQDELAAMTDEEQTRVAVEFLIADHTDGEICVPRKVGKEFIRGTLGERDTMYSLVDFDYTGLKEKLIRPETNNYMMINTYVNHPFNTKSDYISHINGLFIDLDVLHDIDNKIDKLAPEQGEEKIRYERLLAKRPFFMEWLLNKLIEFVDMAIIPNPSALICTGRGYALHYQYSTSISVKDDETIKLHTGLFNAILNKFDELIMKYPECEEMLLDVDKCVTNLDRCARLAGTMNTKAKRAARILSMDRRYGLDEMIVLFGLNKEIILSSPQGTIAEKKSSKQKAKSAQPKSRKEKKKKEYSFSFDCNDWPYVPKPWRDVCKFNLRCLDNFFDKRIWVEGAHRERFCFIVYNCAKVLYGQDKAREIIYEYSSRMKEPLSEKELYWAIHYTDIHVEESEYHGDGVYIFNPLTILRSDWLNIPYELAVECGFYNSRLRKENAVRNNEISARRDRKIAELYLIYDYGYKRIVKELPEDLACAKSTVVDTLKRLELRKEDKGNGALINFVDFEANRRYKKGRYHRGTETNLTSKKDFLKGETTARRFINPQAGFLYEHLTGSTITKNEEDVLQILEQSRKTKTPKRLCIHGGAGSGKTRVLTAKFYPSLKGWEMFNTVFLAPTGKAACLLPQGTTIHKFFELPLTVLPLLDEVPIMEKLKYVDRIVIDEIGTLRNDCFTRIMQLVTAAEKHYNKSIQVIVVGDFLQIGPVLKPEEKTEYYKYFKGVYAFHSKYWSDFEMLFFVGQARFEGSGTVKEKFVKEIEASRFCCLDSIEYFNENLDHEALEGELYICPNNAQVQSYNRAAINKLSNIKILEGLVENRSTPIDEKGLKTKAVNIKLAKGMPVMGTENTEMCKNGQMGTVIRINRKSVTVHFENDEGYRRVERYKTQIPGGGTLMQFPLTPAYAITIHKCQGMTVNHVNIVPGFFAHGQQYVALSRARTQDGIHLLGKLTEKDLIMDEEVLNYLVSAVKKQLREMDVNMKEEFLESEMEEVDMDLYENYELSL